MKFHHTNLGSFAANIPTDGEGYIRCDPRKVEAIKAAIRANKPCPDGADTGRNVLVAQAELDLEDWRNGKSPRYDLDDDGADLDLDDDTLAAELLHDGWSVVDPMGGRWWPHVDTHEEIVNAVDPEAAAVFLCRNEPQRGTWHQ